MLMARCSPKQRVTANLLSIHENFLFLYSFSAFRKYLLKTSIINLGSRFAAIQAVLFSQPWWATDAVDRKVNSTLSAHGAIKAFHILMIAGWLSMFLYASNTEYSKLQQHPLYHWAYLRFTTSEFLVSRTSEFFISWLLKDIGFYEMTRQTSQCCWIEISCLYQNTIDQCSVQMKLVQRKLVAVLSEYYYNRYVKVRWLCQLQLVSRKMSAWLILFRLYTTESWFLWTNYQICFTAGLPGCFSIFNCW